MRHEVPTVRKPRLPREVLIQEIIDEAEKDLNQLNGPQFIKERLKDKGILVSRYVYLYLHLQKVLNIEQGHRE